LLTDFSNLREAITYIAQQLETPQIHCYLKSIKLDAPSPSGQHLVKIDPQRCPSVWGQFFAPTALKFPTLDQLLRYNFSIAEGSWAQGRYIVRKRAIRSPKRGLSKKFVRKLPKSQLKKASSSKHGAARLANLKPFGWSDDVALSIGICASDDAD
jgi:hypothetical protein